MSAQRCENPAVSGIEHLCAAHPHENKKEKRKENERFNEVKRSNFKKKKRKKCPFQGHKTCEK